jgi:hypothetical protein
LLSKQEEELERREVLGNDRRVREQQSSTFHQHAQAQADEINQGRFAATGVPNVIGAKPTPASQYPAASSAHQTELPPEPPLGYPIGQMPSTPPASVEQLGGAEAPPVPCQESSAAPPSFSPDDGGFDDAA